MSERIQAFPREFEFRLGTPWRYPFFIYACLFFLALDQRLMYLPLAAAALIVNADNVFINLFKRSANIFNLMIFLLTVAYLVTLFGIGSDQLTFNQPFSQLFTYLFKLLLITLFFVGQNFSMAVRLIGAYLIGIFFLSAYTAYYSFNTDPVNTGYGLLISPFSGDEVNSPGYSNNLGLFCVFILYFLLRERALLLKLFFATLFAIAFMAAIFLGGRAFFYILVLSILVYLLNASVIKELLSYKNLGVLSVAVVFSVYFSWVYYEDLVRYLDLILIRLSILESSDHVNADAYQKGAESERFQLYATALEKILSSPTGGFKTDSWTPWFHNIFLDTARVAGWLPMLLLLGQLFILVALLKRRGSATLFMVKWFAVAVFIMMQQDVVIEGNSNVYLLFIMSLYSLVSGRLESGSSPLRVRPSRTRMVSGP